MIIETIIIGSALVAGRQSVLGALKRRNDRAAREMWLREIHGSQEISAQLSTARQAMVEEARRHQGVSQLRDGDQ